VHELCPTEYHLPDAHRECQQTTGTMLYEITRCSPLRAVRIASHPQAEFSKMPASRKWPEEHRHA
jgi:hypothetical protein